MMGSIQEYGRLMPCCYGGITHCLCLRSLLRRALTAIRKLRFAGLDGLSGSHMNLINAPRIFQIREIRDVLLRDGANEPV
jgi:hypothetical protein